MPVREVWSPFHGRPVKLGRQPSSPEAIARAPKFADVARRAAMAAPPAQADYSGPAIEALKDIYLNDREGDCVIAADWHCLGVWSGNAGKLIVASDAEINADYGAVAGYNGDPSTDVGCDPATANQHFLTNGFADTGIKLTAAPAVNATIEAEVQQATVASGGCLVIAMGLPDRWLQNMPSGPGFTWDYEGEEPNPANGHQIMAYGYDRGGVWIDTWGLVAPGNPSRLTWRALAYYAGTARGGECYALMFPGASPSPGPTPDPNPTPDPGPGPSPSPTPSPTNPPLGWKFARAALGVGGEVLTNLGNWIDLNVPGVKDQGRKP